MLAVVAYQAHNLEVGGAIPPPATNINMIMNHWKQEIPLGDSTPYHISNWYASDTEEQFDKNQPNGWTKDSITYSFNSHGYRSQEFVKNENFTVLSIGCSVSFGSGLSLEQTWPEKFCRKLEKNIYKPVNNFNFSKVGQGNDYIVRKLYKVIPVIQPDLVLIYFSESSRREYILDDNRLYSVGAWWTDKKWQKDSGIAKESKPIINSYFI